MSPITIIQFINLVITIVFLILIPIKMRGIKELYEKYGVYAIYSVFMHIFVYEIFVLIKHLELTERVITTSGWPAIIIFQLITTLFLKEYLKIAYLKNRD